MERQVVGKLTRFGDSRRQSGARAMWARRKSQWGPTGFSPKGYAGMVAAKRQPRPKMRRTHCVRGHKYTAANTYWRPYGRFCLACMKIRDGQKKWRGVKVDRLKRLRDAMIAAHPDKGGTARAFVLARARYLKEKSRAS